MAQKWQYHYSSADHANFMSPNQSSQLRLIDAQVEARKVSDETMTAVERAAEFAPGADLIVETDVRGNKRFTLRFPPVK